jgi:outer membrane protein TolC
VAHCGVACRDLGVCPDCAAIAESAVDCARRAPGAWRILAQPAFHVDPTKTYTLPEVIDLAQHHNPDTRVAWEQARARAAALGVARSELYPMLTAAAVARANRSEVLVGHAFIREDVRTAALAFDLTYMVFDSAGEPGASTSRGPRRSRRTSRSTTPTAGSFSR